MPRVRESEGASHSLPAATYFERQVRRMDRHGLIRDCALFLLGFLCQPAVTYLMRTLFR